MRLSVRTNFPMFIGSLLAGMLLCIPASVHAGDIITGRIVQVEVEQRQLTLIKNGTDQVKMTVQYTDQTFICGNTNTTSRGCCMHPGKAVEIEGAFSASDATLFLATSITGIRNRNHRDPTGVRARLHSCTGRPPTANN